VSDMYGVSRSGVAQHSVAKPVEQYALRLGDDALLLSFRLSEWVTGAPGLEEEMALANIAQNLRGQARFLLAAAGQSTAQDEHLLAYQRSDREYRNVLLVELPNGDFAVTIAKLLFLATAQLRTYRALADGPDERLAAIGAKAAKESAYHLDHAMVWTLRLGDGTPESHDRMQAAIDQLWPYTHELELGDTVDGVLAAARLRRPAADTWRPGGGRTGVHTEHLGYLLAEMQVLHRAHPGAQW
jgi:ring-1,2-phenylacetyl-CoA epoxidase subunit PaaC